jgi:two-component system, cell cycle sensor histidine kinase and response regulator CckA
VEVIDASQRPRVLYVEDNHLVREITRELLAESGREIVAVSSAEDALRAFQNYPFDVLVTDLSLPAMSGVELIQSVQRIRPDIPVILASGYQLAIDEFHLGEHVRALTNHSRPLS